MSLHKNYIATGQDAPNFGMDRQIRDKRTKGAAPSCVISAK